MKCDQCHFLRQGICGCLLSEYYKMDVSHVNGCIRFINKLITSEELNEGLSGLEHDPNGTPPNAPGAKLDAGKNRLGLVLFGFSRALQEVGKVGTFGANKYTDNGWIEVPDGINRYTDAMLRHLMKEAEGELNDPDSELIHAAHTAWNALARLDLMLRNNSNETTL